MIKWPQVGFVKLAEYIMHANQSVKFDKYMRLAFYNQER